MMKKPFAILPPWMMYFFLASHLAMWFVSFGQTYWIVRELQKDLRRLQDNKKI
jgi:hypothetical protein